MSNDDGNEGTMDKGKGKGIVDDSDTSSDTSDYGPDYHATPEEDEEEEEEEEEEESEDTPVVEIVARADLHIGEAADEEEAQAVCDTVARARLELGIPYEAGSFRQLHLQAMAITAVCKAKGIQPGKGKGKGVKGDKGDKGAKGGGKGGKGKGPY